MSAPLEDCSYISAPKGHRCIAPLCYPIGCSGCNCALPADVYAAVFRHQQEVREALVNLLAALDATNWSSWQTTARFAQQMESARAVLGML